MPGGGVRDRLARADLVLALTPEQLDERGPVPDNTDHVGPILRPEAPLLPAEDRVLLDRPGNPWVLISLSTTQQGQAAVLPMMQEAVGSLPVRGLLTLGGVLPPESVRAPSNVTVRGHVPHDAVLPRMSAVLTHAGLSTITTALAFGCPWSACLRDGTSRSTPHGSRRWAPDGHCRATPRRPAIASALAEVLASHAIREAAARFYCRQAGRGLTRITTRRPPGIPALPANQPARRSCSSGMPRRSWGTGVPTFSSSALTSSSSALKRPAAIRPSRMLRRSRG